MEEKTRILKKINQECQGGIENQLRLLLNYLPDKIFSSSIAGNKKENSKY